MKKLKTILQSRYLFKITALIALTASILITKLYPYRSLYNKKETNFSGKIISKKIDGDKLTLIVKKKKN